MSYRTAAVRQLRDYLSVAFLGIFSLTGALVYYIFGTFNLIFLGILSTLGSGFLALRLRNPIKEALAKASMRDANDRLLIEIEQQAERDRRFNMACAEIAEMMSKLSDGDLSVFISAHRYLRNNAAETFGFKTSQGSPMHHVLVAMVDVGCTRPTEMKRIAPAVDLTIATYVLTSRGKDALELFIQDAFRYRAERSQHPRQ